MPLITSDSFTDATGTLLENHSGETGAVWTKNPAFASGSAAVTAAGRLRGNATNGIYFSSATPASADYDVEADLYVASGVNNAGLLGRQSTSAATYYLFDFENGNTFKLYTLLNGSVANTVSYTLSLSAGQTVRLRLSMRGGQIAGFVNGVQVLQMTDANITAPGRAGLYFSAANTDSTGVHLDNFTAAIPVTTPVTDAGLFFSPYNWYSDGAGAPAANNVNASSTLAMTNTPGAYLKVGLGAASAGNATLLLDTTPLAGITAANCPTIETSVDGGAFAPQLLVYAAGVTRVPLAVDLPAGAHSIVVYFRGVDTSATLSMGDRWNTPAGVVKVTGLELDGKGTATATPATRAKRLIVFGDSITEGVDAVGATNANGDQDATQTYAQILALGLEAEVGTIGFAGQGWATAGYGNVPKFYDPATPGNSTFDKYFAGQSRLHAGAFRPVPDYALVLLGRNDASFGATDAAVTSAVSAWLGAMRADAPSTRIVLVSPIDGSKRAAVAAGFASANDPNAVLLDLGTAIQASFAPGGMNTNDGIHPNVRGHATVAAMLLDPLRNVPGDAASSARSTGQFSGAGVGLTDGTFATS